MSALYEPRLRRGWALIEIMSGFCMEKRCELHSIFPHRHGFLITDYVRNYSKLQEGPLWVEIFFGPFFFLVGVGGKEGS